MNTRDGLASRNPFPGLRPFREDEEALFFGRESQVDTLVDTLAATRFLAVVGSSGSGKSSLVNCGLVPALHRGLLASAGSGWRVAIMRPGHRPIHALAQALAQPGVLPQPDAEAAGFSATELVESTLRMGKLGLLEAYRESVPEQASAGPRNLLVVVDQFEELFRYRGLAAAVGEASASETAIAFINLLLEVTSQRQLPVYVVLTMRSDFLGDCAQFSGLPEAINRGQYLVPRMSRDERRAAIAGPLRVCGADIDPVLLTRLVNDVGDNPDQLSILQHALNRTWARWRDDGARGPLALPHYEAVGTMAHALNQHAEEAFAELPNGEPRALCEALFKAITDKGTDARGTRRPTRLDELCAITGATVEALTAVMAGFRDPSRAFLMPPHGAPLTPDTPVDISHESLMRVWQRLRQWGDDEAQSAQTYRRLAETAELKAAGQAGLLGPPELQVALSWRDRRRPTAAWAQRYRRGFDAAMGFLDESAQAFEAARRQDAEQQAEAQRLRQEAFRSRQNRRWWMAVAPLALAAIAGLTLLYLDARDKQAKAERVANFALDETARANEAAASAAAALAESEQFALAYRRLEDVQQAQAAVLQRVTQGSPRARNDVAQAVANKPVVYLQYADPAQQAEAERLQKQLLGAGYRAPGIDLVKAVPEANELRYFRDTDADTARQLAAQLGRWGIAPLSVKAVSGFDNRSAVRQFELWLARPRADNVRQLARQLLAPDKQDRLAAGQALQSRHTGSTEAIDAVLSLLEPSRQAGPSVEGRINALYFLSRTAPGAWTDELQRRGRVVVARIESGDDGVGPVGSQTRAELDRFKSLLQSLQLGSKRALKG